MYMYPTTNRAFRRERRRYNRERRMELQSCPWLRTDFRAQRIHFNLKELRRLGFVLPETR